MFKMISLLRDVWQLRAENSVLKSQVDRLERELGAAPEDLEGKTVIGILQEGSMPLARALKAEDAIESVTVEGARDHEYKPVTNPKK